MNDALLFVTSDELKVMESMLFTYFTDPKLSDDEVTSPYYKDCCTLNIKVYNVIKSARLKNKIIYTPIPPDR